MGNLSNLEEKLAAFAKHFELVFDFDWEFTRSRIESEGYINGTFLNPNVEDEENNWGNRGGLLKSYRALVVAMTELGIPPHFSTSEANHP